MTLLRHVTNTRIYNPVIAVPLPGTSTCHRAPTSFVVTCNKSRKGTTLKASPMNQSAHMSKDHSPTAHTPGSSPPPAQILPKMPAEPATETHPGPVPSHSATSSPAEPFPELDLEVGAEPNPSPTFAHEADMRILPAALSLPGPAVQRMRALDTGPVILARMTWTDEQESEEESGDMKEATARALECARKMFRRDAESRVEGGMNSGHGNVE